MQDFRERFLGNLLKGTEEDFEQKLARQLETVSAEFAGSPASRSRCTSSLPATRSRFPARERECVEEIRRLVGQAVRPQLAAA